MSEEAIAASPFLRSAVSSPSTATLAFTLSMGFMAGSTTCLFLTTRELLRVDMQWEGMAPSLYAGMLTGAALGAVTGGPYSALLGTATVGGLSILGEGGVALYGQWYERKRQQVLEHRLVERQQALMRQRDQMAGQDEELRQQMDQQLAAVTDRLSELRGRHEEHDRTNSDKWASWMALKLPSWSPVRPLTDEQLREKRAEEALEREMLARYYAEREREYQRERAEPVEDQAVQ